MSTNFPHPAEIPEGGEGGSGSGIRFRPGIGGPNELPPFEFSAFSRNVLQEIFSLRNRVHSLESNLLASRFGVNSARVTVGGPNELPEGGEGGGGVVVRPPKEIAELPPFLVNREFTSLLQRFSSLEQKVTESLQAVTARLDSLRK